MKTDAQIQRDVTAQLQWDPAIQATQIGVQVKNGVVSIAGQVASYTGKLHAERVARGAAGVRALAVEITVKLIGSDQRTDAELAQSALNALEWTASLEPDSVKVQVEGGWITLSGEVAWQHRRQAAADAVRHLIGTVGVGNQVAIRHKPEARPRQGRDRAWNSRRRQADSGADRRHGCHPERSRPELVGARPRNHRGPELRGGREYRRQHETGLPAPALRMFPCARAVGGAR
jgi:osmotically-inducible protein OsmY